MAKKNNAIYAPGELSRVRDKLGVTNEAEARRMMQLLGGEVGTERAAEAKKPVRRENVEVVIGGKPRRRRIEVAGDGDERGMRPKQKPLGPYPGDDPEVPARLSYAERVKIDQFAGQPVFEIKNSMQILTSIFSFFREPIDFVNPRFVTVRMNEYFNKIERLVNSTRNLFPKNNTKRNNQLKRISPFVYKILDTLREWDIEELAKSIASLQSQPRMVKVTDFVDVLKIIYTPLFVLDDLSAENIKTAFKLVYKVLYIESPMEAKDKYQDLIRNIIASLIDIRRTVHYGMYPLVMKIISDRYITYDRFFIERQRRFTTFLNITDAEQLNAADLIQQQVDSIDVEALQKNLQETDDNPEEAEAAAQEEEDQNDPKVIERKAKEEAEKSEQKALSQGRAALEALFPKAGWDKLSEFPDLYPYFRNVYSMRHGYELISPTDPMQQVAVLMNILDDLFIGLRSANFSTIIGPDGKPIRIAEELNDTLNSWRRYIEDCFSKDYLPRLTEYCRILENSKDARSSAYARKTMNELHWIKRLFFLPYYKFESIGPPPFPKSEIIPVYSMIRKIRKYLTSVAIGIEQGMRSGGAASKAPCNGIHNPWDPFVYQVPNPVSKRLDLLLPQERKSIASIIFFTLSTVTILDFLINNESSWAYEGRPGPVFRSVKNDGITPMFGVDDVVEADQIFKDSLKKS